MAHFIIDTQSHMEKPLRAHINELEKRVRQQLSQELMQHRKTLSEWDSLDTIEPIEATLIAVIGRLGYGRAECGQRCGG